MAFQDYRLLVLQLLHSPINHKDTIIDNLIDSGLDIRAYNYSFFIGLAENGSIPRLERYLDRLGAEEKLSACDTILAKGLTHSFLCVLKHLIETKRYSQSGLHTALLNALDYMDDLANKGELEYDHSTYVKLLIEAIETPTDVPFNIEEINKHRRFNKKLLKFHSPAEYFDVLKSLLAKGFDPEHIAWLYDFGEFLDNDQLQSVAKLLVKYEYLPSFISTSTSKELIEESGLSIQTVTPESNPVLVRLLVHDQIQNSQEGIMKMMNEAPSWLRPLYVPFLAQ